MKRRLAVLALVASASVGLAGCSSDTPKADEATQPPAATQEDKEDTKQDPAEEAPEEEKQPDPDELDPYYGVGVANESCQVVLDAIGDGSDAADADFSTPEGAKQYVEAMNAQAARISAAIPNVSDEAVKGAAQTLHDTLLSFVDGMQKVYVDGDPSAGEQFGAAGEAYGQAVEGFYQLCLPDAYTE